MACAFIHGFMVQGVICITRRLSGCGCSQASSSQPSREGPLPAVAAIARVHVHDPCLVQLLTRAGVCVCCGPPDVPCCARRPPTLPRYFIYGTIEGVSFQPKDVPVGPVSATLGKHQVIRVGGK